ncbi:MAG TPA: YdeI/OmpD-associated family protein [Gemmatimonadaceae bacterium]|nr:YdeI/OmpD-associated family protein [Gemmatimonadaceae bacterium]
MPASVRKQLVGRGLLDAYRERPPYQRNDYLSWISRAKREETRRRRMQQMLAELERGDLYMRMSYRPRKTA